MSDAQPKSMLPIDEQRLIVDIANRVQATMTGDPGGDYQIVKREVETHDVVWAIWQDPAEITGVRFMLVKGMARLQRIVADGVAEHMGVSAIPCADEAQACALISELGEPDRRH